MLDGVRVAPRTGARIETLYLARIKTRQDVEGRPPHGGAD